MKIYCSTKNLKMSKNPEIDAEVAADACCQKNIDNEKVQTYVINYGKHGKTQKNIIHLKVLSV